MYKKLNLYEVLFKTFLVRDEINNHNWSITFEPLYFNQTFHEPIFNDPNFGDKIIVTEQNGQGQVKKTLVNYHIEDNKLVLNANNQLPYTWMITRPADVYSNYEL